MKKEDLENELDLLNKEFTSLAVVGKNASEKMAAISYRRSEINTELEKLKREEGEDLESKFEKAQSETEGQINAFLKQAKEAIKKAIDLSEETGIPFSSTVVDLQYYDHIGGDDVYVPKSLKTHWGELFEENGMSDFLYDHYGAHPLDNEYYDFDHGFCISWAPSSMRC